MIINKTRNGTAESAQSTPTHPWPAELHPCKLFVHSKRFAHSFSWKQTTRSTLLAIIYCRQKDIAKSNNNYVSIFTTIYLAYFAKLNHFQSVVLPNCYQAMNSLPSSIKSLIYPSLFKSKVNAINF